MKMIIVLLGLALFTIYPGSSLLGQGNAVYIYRIISSQSETMRSLSASGVVSWSNSVPGSVATIQQASGAGSFNWQDYVSVQTTGDTEFVRIFAPEAPTHMAWIPPGIFVMGGETNVGHVAGSSQLPQHTVSISGFLLDRYEVTYAMWEIVRQYSVTNGYSYTNLGGGKAPDHPVHSVSWFDAVKWCNARSEHEGLNPVYFTDPTYTNLYKSGEATPFVKWSASGYRLPTEAEWEKSARGGAAFRRFPWGDSNLIQHDRANYFSTTFFAFDTSPTRGYHPAYEILPTPHTSPVGSFAPNGYGLYDMAGNVTEWCWDWQSNNYYAISPLTDPRGPDGPLSSRVHRGGSWDSDGNGPRVAGRNGSSPTSESYNRGFRCARSN